APAPPLEPEPGDLIEIFCVGYQHWAVYVGDRDTVHLVNPPEPFFYIFQVWICRGQKKEKLIDVVGNNKWQINNILDTEYKSRPAQRIVKNALLFVAKDVNYTMSSWNCEHFASEQRYAVPPADGALLCLSSGTECMHQVLQHPTPPEPASLSVKYKIDRK
uniref:LRAT domain-containing protein n=1 Tax=Lates calcarifer TaxID=8187 RepID=A0A4W6FZP2_LATCA